MRSPTLRDRVRLIHAIPTLWLQCGEVGVVRSIWLSSPRFFEVEFRRSGESSAVHALVQAADLEVIKLRASSAPATGVTS